jgi:serine/threonine protein kinase
LGTGAYAAVKEAVHKTTGLVLAIKIYEKYKLMDAAKKKSVVREVSALTKLNHPNIMQLHDVIETPK